jgi:hypothetical protein
LAPSSLLLDLVVDPDPDKSSLRTLLGAERKDDERSGLLLIFIKPIIGLFSSLGGSENNDKWKHNFF